MRVLVTGGAGFIGSHVVDALVGEGHEVRVLDDLSNGIASNLPGDVDLMTGDVADSATSTAAAKGAEVVFHLAAVGSVPRSVEDPLGSDRANSHGTLSVLRAAHDAGATRVVVSSSSSVYGGSDRLPTPESEPTVPRSPYAVSKLAAEEYARVYAELFGLPTVTLRYFNVFGPRQRPDSPYAAVIPLFVAALHEDRPLTIYGDGLQQRDFTYVSDVVSGNLAAAFAPAERCAGRVFNLAAGGSHTVLELAEVLESIIGVTAVREHASPRPGDIHQSGADITAALAAFDWAPAVNFAEGLALTVEWYRDRCRS